MRTWCWIGRLSAVTILLGGMAWVLIGCEKPSAPPPITRKAPVRKEVAKAPPPEKSSTPQKAAVFSYNPQGLVDPFKPFIQIGASAKPVPGVPRTPLQEYDLSQLKLTAIIWLGSDESRAMVEDSAGKGFTVQKGTYIGKRGGKVKVIHKDRVVVEVPLGTLETGSKTREIVMKMPEEGGAK
jgi:Tfp pilus assembly protein PilP